MENNSNIIKEIVRRAIDLQDWIKANASGGTTPPREVKDIVIAAERDESLHITVKWKYPRTGGLSDRIYHIKDSDIHETTFVYKDDVLARAGGKLFDDEGFSCARIDEAIARFYAETGLNPRVA